MISKPTLASVAGLGLEPVDEIDHVVESAASAAADAASGDGDGKMGLAGASSADQHGIALLGDDELVLDRPRLLLADLGVEQITDDALRFVLAFDGRGHDLVEGGLHAVELELAHEVEELSSFHQLVLLRLS